MLTLKQKNFARHLAEGMTASDAARVAGYACENDASLRVTASRLQRHPEVQQATFQHRESRLHGPLAEKAIGCLGGILDDPDAPAAARVAAARFVLEAAGHGIESRRLTLKMPTQDDRNLSTLSIADLEDLVRRQESNLANLRGASSRVIDAEELENATADLDPADT